jgi:hypothetical protein
LAAVSIVDQAEDFPGRHVEFEMVDDVLLAAKETDTEYGTLFDVHWLPVALTKPTRG